MKFTVGYSGDSEYYGVKTLCEEREEHRYGNYRETR